MNIKDIIKNNTVRFDRYRHGVVYYKIDIWGEPEDENLSDRVPYTYSFPVPLDDIGDATLPAEEKAIMFMRYIRKALEDKTFVRV